MTMTVDFPLQNGTYSYTQVFGTGVACKLQALVRGVEQNGSEGVDHQVLRALKETHNIQCGNQLAGQPNLFIKEITINGLKDNTNEKGSIFICDVICVPYSEMDDKWTIEYNSGQEQQTVFVDIFGNPLVTQYLYPVDWPNTYNAGQYRSQGAELQRLDARLTATARGIKKLTNPGMYIINYTSSTNSRSFLGMGPGKWLCTSANTKLYALESDGIHKYMMSLTFQLDIDNHVQTYCFRRDDGTIPPDLMTGISKKHAVMYNNYDFNDLFN